MTPNQPLPDRPVRNQPDLDRPPQVLVTGGTGKTGRRVVQRLRANSVPVRVGSRRGSPAFDWAEPATWPDVLDGISSVYVAYYPDLVMPGAVETVAALFDAIHNGQVYELTGPGLLTFTDVAAEISGRVARPIRYTAVSPAEFTATMVGQGVPAELAEPLAGLFARVLDGRNAYVADGVKEVLGRDPRTFARYAAAAAESGVWHRKGEV